MKIVLRTNFTIAMMYCTLEATRPLAAHLSGKEKKNGMTLAIMISIRTHGVGPGEGGGSLGTVEGRARRSWAQVGCSAKLNRIPFEFP